MKKLLILAACAVGLSYTASAKIGLTPVAGLNIANVGGDASGTDSKMGFHIGLLKSFNITESFSIQPGLLFSAKGYEIADIGMGMNYLEIPVNAVYKFGDGDGGFMLHAGPYLGYMINATVEGEAIDDYDGVNRMDFGLNVGVGYQLPMGLMFRAQYGLGLASTTDGDAKVPNRVIGITVGYTL